MSQPSPVDGLASELLIDIEVAYGYARPIKSRRIFQFLQPQYSDARDEDVVDRLADAFDALDTDDKRDLFRLAVVEALTRCAGAWLGVTRTLAVATLAFLIARESLPSDIWERLLERNDPNSPSVTATWLDRLIRALKAWGIQTNVRWVNWAELLIRSDTRALPIAAEWVLHQLRHDPELSLIVYKQSAARIRDERHSLTRHWPDIEEIRDRIDAAFLSGVSPEEKRRFFRHAKEESDAGREVDRVELKAWSLSGINDLDSTKPGDMDLEYARGGTRISG